MSTADQIQQQLQRSLQRAENEARKAAAAEEVVTFEGAKDAFDGALKEKAGSLRAIKPKPTKVARKEGESPAVAEARGHQSRAVAEADAEMQRAEVMEDMHPVAQQRDRVAELAQAAKQKLSALMGEASDNPGQSA